MLYLLAVSAISSPLVAQDAEEERYRDRRQAIVDLIVSRGVKDTATLAAMRAVPRHEYVPTDSRRYAYDDHPLPIGYGQTISQPYIVAFMTEMLHPAPGMKVLEVGTSQAEATSRTARMPAMAFKR